MSTAPAGYVRERRGGAVVIALPAAIEAVHTAIARHGSLHAAAAAAPAARRFAGRGAAFHMTAPDGDWVVRHYRRGGAVARVLHDEFPGIGVPRPFRELHASMAARDRGVRTPEVVAAVTYPAAGGLFYRADLATRLVPDATDLAALSLEGAADGAARQEGWFAAGALLQSIFAAGVLHPDLNLRNLLITRAASGGASATLIDLDRAAVRDRAVSDVARRRMLERVHRSRRKLESEYGVSVTAEELTAFAAGLAEPHD